MSYTPLGTLAALSSLTGLDASAATVKPTGATTARSIAKRTTDSYNVLDNGLVADGATDNTSALQTLLNRCATVAASQGGGTVEVSFPATGSSYGFAGVVAIPAGVRLVGLGKPTLTCLGSSGSLFTIGAVSNVEMKNLRIDTRNSVNTGIAIPLALNGATGRILLEDIEIANPTGGISITSSYGVVVNRPIISNSLQHGVYLNASYDCTVANGQFQSNVGFGIILTNGCYRVLVEGNRTTSNGIELVGVTQNCYENRIAFNHSENTGDNGISITGFKNIVVGNVCKGCQGNGIECYGERNLLVGNQCHNNAKGNSGNAGWRGGIAIQPAFGGAGQYNTITGNILDDDQATPTQLYGVWIGASSYTAWTTGTAYGTIGTYVTNAGSLYLSTTSGTAGATAPTWTNTQSDGGVSWQFVRTLSTGTSAAAYNEISSNMVRNFGTARFLDASGGANNEFIGGLVPVTVPSPLVVSQISNPGGVSSIGLPSGNYSYSNGSFPTISIGAPTGTGGGQTATAVVSVMMLLGFGSVSAAGTGYVVNDILTLVGGTTTGTSNPLTIKVTSIGTNGTLTGFTAYGGTFTYTALPPAGVTYLSGGSGSGATLTGTVWHVYTITVTAAGSNYVSVPTVTYSPSASPAVSTAVLSGAMTINAGIGNIALNSTGTNLGIVGASGAPVISLGASIDGSGVRTTLTGAAYTIPANTSLVRFIQSATISAQTITLPTALADGQPIQFLCYSGAITALTFSPAVNGFSNGSGVSANTGLRIRWDATSAAWQREA